MSMLQQIENEQQRRDFSFRPGDTVRVHVRISEGEKDRIQVFEGVVIALKRAGSRSAFTVRKVSYSVGVERVFPLNSPSIDKVEVVSSGKVRRAKLYFLRQRHGKAARLRERERYRALGLDTAAAGEGAEAVEAAAGEAAAGEG